MKILAEQLGQSMIAQEVAEYLKIDVQSVHSTISSLEVCALEGPIVSLKGG